MSSYSIFLTSSSLLQISLEFSANYHSTARVSKFFKRVSDSAKEKFIQGYLKDPFIVNYVSAEEGKEEASVSSSSSSKRRRVCKQAKRKVTWGHAQEVYIRIINDVRRMADGDKLIKESLNPDCCFCPKRLGNLAMRVYSLSFVSLFENILSGGVEGVSNRKMNSLKKLLKKLKKLLPEVMIEALSSFFNNACNDLQVSSFNVTDQSQQFYTIPREIGLLKTITSLEVSKGIQTLPKELFDLTRLRRLELDGNQLTAIPNRIGQLKELRVLTLGKNKLSQLPLEMCELVHLTKLDLEENEFTVFPVVILSLRKLEILSLKMNKIKIIPGEICDLTSLKALCLSSNPLLSIPEGLKLNGSLKLTI